MFERLSHALHCSAERSSLMMMMMMVWTKSFFNFSFNPRSNFRGFSDPKWRAVILTYVRSPRKKNFLWILIEEMDFSSFLHFQLGEKGQSYYVHAWEVDFVKSLKNAETFHLFKVGVANASKGFFRYTSSDSFIARAKIKHVITWTLNCVQFTARQ